MKTNNKMFLKTVIIAVLSVFTYAAKAQPNLVQNGSFESGIIQLCNSSAGIPSSSLHQAHSIGGR